MPRPQVLVALTALTIVFDGAAMQLLGIAVPALAADWQVPRSAFAPLLASGLIGMVIGGSLGGIAGDRLGRRAALVGSVIVFAVFTLVTTLADSLATLGALRFFAGLGFGAAVPNATALTAEYVPLGRRALAVTLTIVCVPLGGSLAAFVASQVLPAYGWRALFAIGGTLPLAWAAVLIAVLPESPQFLARTTSERGSVTALFSHDLRRDTIALWGAFVFGLLAVFTNFNWVPSMLTSAGLDVALASTGMAAFNLGGVAGALAGAFIIARIGSRPAMVGLAAGAVVVALMMSVMPIGGDAEPGPIVLMLGLAGGLINAVQVAMYALAAHVYPTAVRATGVGAAASIGRCGAIASTYAGAWALETGGPQWFFWLIGSAMAVVAASLALVRRHMPAAA